MQSIPDDLKDVLGPHEQAQFYIRQRIYHPKINIDSVIITNQRLILRHPRALRPRKDYTGYDYQDISNVVMEKGILRSTVKCTLRYGGQPLRFGDLPNSDAERAYGLIKENLARVKSPFALSGAGALPPRQQSLPSGFSSAVCRKCGSPLVVGHKYCGNCGVPV
jgi:Bacterial PH domain